MQKETAARLVEENLPAIYGYARSKLYHKEKAEDLTSEIVMEILRSAENLKNEGAFWGFAWKIAENTFRKFIRREQLISQTLSIEGENFIGFLAAPEAPEEDGQIYRLRRELSLLSRRHRDICVAYYVENKSCSVIAKEQNISVEMVKQHLFNARKRLKEGMEMERKLGEKSYNPGTFRLSFWGDWNHYGSICNRKLPGAILLAAYNRPMTAEELSMEVGVAMPYLEEEMEILEAAGLLRRMGKKVETDIVIVPDSYEKELHGTMQGSCTGTALGVFEAVKTRLPQIRAIGFHGDAYDDNRLLFAIVNIVLMNAYEKAHARSPIGPAQPLPLGGNGWVYGYDNNFENMKFLGVYNNIEDIKPGEVSFSAINYRVISPAQRFVHVALGAKFEAIRCAIQNAEADPANEELPWLIENGFVCTDGHRLSANFPVFAKAAFDTLLELLDPMIQEVADCMVKTSDMAEPLLAATAPARLRGQCKDLAIICHRLDTAAFIMEALVETGALTVPDAKVPICCYGVTY